MRVLICGPRDLTDYEAVQDVLDTLRTQYPEINCVISGKAKGVEPRKLASQ